MYELPENATPSHREVNSFLIPRSNPPRIANPNEAKPNASVPFRKGQIQDANRWQGGAIGVRSKPVTE